MCYVVGKVQVYEVGDDVPAMAAPHYVYGSLHVDTTDYLYDSGYWHFNRTSIDDSHRFELNFARYIANTQPGDPEVNRFFEFIPYFWMYRVRALKTIYAGTQLCMGTSIPKRYRVAKDGVLDDFDDSV